MASVAVVLASLALGYVRNHADRKKEAKEKREQRKGEKDGRMREKKEGRESDR